MQPPTVRRPGGTFTVDFVQGPLGRLHHQPQRQINVRKIRHFKISSVFFFKKHAFFGTKTKDTLIISSSSRFEATNRQSIMVPKPSGGSKSTMKHRVDFWKFDHYLRRDLLDQQFQGAIFLMVGLTARVNKRYTHILFIKSF